MARKTIQDNILDATDAVRTIGVRKEGGTAVACAIGIDGIATAAGLEIADADMSDGGYDG